MINKYYVYRHIRLDKNEPFYIGVGTKTDNKVFTSFKQEFSRAFVRRRRKMRIAKEGKKRGYDINFTEEVRQRMSRAAKRRVGKLNPFYGKIMTEAHKIKKSKPVLQYDLNGNFIKEYYGITEASKQTNSTRSLISKVCKKERQSHNNFKWEYKK